MARPAPSYTPKATITELSPILNRMRATSSHCSCWSTPTRNPGTPPVLAARLRRWPRATKRLSSMRWLCSPSASVMRPDLVTLVCSARSEADMSQGAITELAESQTSDSTIMSIAGHVSPKMLAHYSHVRIQAKRTALDALAAGHMSKTAERPISGSKAEGYDTNNDTKQVAQEEQVPQVLENMVELVGIEPTT